MPAIESNLADDYLFEDALCALQSVTRGELPGVDLLVARLRSPRTYVACAAARALARTTGDPETARTALISAVFSSDSTLEEEARAALRRMGRKQKRTVSAPVNQE